MLRILLFFIALSLPHQLPANAQGANHPEQEEKKSVIEMTPEELRYAYRTECAGIQFDTSQGSPSSILERAGNKVVSFFRDFANTSAIERVRLQRYDLISYQKQQRSQPKLMEKRLPGAATERYDSNSINGILAFKERSLEFSYLILPNPDNKTRTWREDRTDKKGDAVSAEKITGFTMSSGYACLALYIHPERQQNSHFRYLGCDNNFRSAHVLAFAQKPEARDYLANYTDETGSGTRFLVEGFIWLDPDSYQILRVRTDMLASETPTTLRETVTDIRYAKVRFERSSQEFWLPREINVSWEFKPQNGRSLVYRNRHLYSDYHLFTVASDYTINPK